MSKQVSQIIPREQQKVLVESLNIMETVLKSINSEDVNLNNKLFDITTLKAMLNQTELVVNLPFHVYDGFTSINGVDFPEYS